MEQQQQQPAQQQPEPKIIQVTGEHGTFELHIIGDPIRLMDIPIAYYERADKRFRLANQ